MVLNTILEKVSPVSVAIAVVTFTIAYYFWKLRGLPPGPTGLPFLGFWPFMKNESCHIQFDEMKKKYGDVFCFTCMGTLYIHLGSIKVAREAHVTKVDCFGERFMEEGLFTFILGNGVFFTNGESWKTLRKYFIQVLKNRLSIKNNKLEAMDETITSTLDNLKAKEGETFNIVELMTEKCTSIVRVTLFENSEVTNEHIREINTLYLEVLGSMLPSNTLATGLIAKYFILPFNAKYRKGIKNQVEIEKIIYRMIDEHKSTYREDNIRDIIDEFLKERNERRSKGNPTAKYFTDAALVANLAQFIGDGVVAVAALIGVVIRVLVDHPEEQEKINKEIIEVVGADRQPSLEDKSRLVYLNAFILESLRTSEFLLLFPNQECKKETTLNGYRIPKGAVTVLNVWSAHYDSASYEGPLTFNPSRFLNKEGKRKEEAPVTFGVGKRSCMGEGFTMAQVFLFFATLIKNFHLRLPDNNSKNSLEDWLSGKLFISAVPRTQ